MASYVLDPLVEDELMVIWRFIAANNLVAADHVIEAAYETFGILASMPGMGRLGRFSIPAFSNVRFWPMVGFDKYLVLYRAYSERIQVLHVIHAAQNLETIFRDDSN